MTSVNAVSFMSVEKTKRYAVNSQFLRHFSGPKQPLSIRLDCTLKPHSTRENKIAGNSFIEFVCVRPGHEDRFCSHDWNAIKIPQNAFTSFSSVGNILVQLHSCRCHACGESSDRCWAEYTEHKICATCIDKGYGMSPYPYGFVNRRCCNSEGCGSGLTLYSASSDNLYKKAIEIYERYYEYGF